MQRHVHTYGNTHAGTIWRQCNEGLAQQARGGECHARIGLHGGAVRLVPALPPHRRQTALLKRLPQSYKHCVRC